MVAALTVISPLIESRVHEALVEVVVNVYKKLPEATLAAPFNVIFLNTG